MQLLLTLTMNRSLSLRAPSHMVDDIDAAIRTYGFKDRTELCLRALQDFLLRLQMAPTSDAVMQAVGSVDRRVTALQADVQTTMQCIIRMAESNKDRADESRMQRAAIQAVLTEMTKLSATLSALETEDQ